MLTSGRPQARAGRLYGLIAEFASPEAVLEAARRTAAAGYTRAEAYTPFPVEGLSAALGFRRTRVPLIVLIGAIVGAVGAFGMQWYANVLSYHWNIGGKPPNSWPAFIPITFELGVLGAAVSAVVGMLALNGLPQPYHSVFNAPRFTLASRDRFFLCIEAVDPMFDREATRQLLEQMQPIGIEEVPL
jgi:hypothetical protein